MTYIAKETSVNEGQPLELYRFEWGANVLLYSSGDENFIDGDDVYTPVPIERSTTDINSTGQVSPVTLRVPRDFPVAGVNVANVPGRTIWLTIRRLHLTDGGAPEQVVFWTGRLVNTAWIGSQAELRCEPINAAIERQCLRRAYQTQCPLMLYAPECGLVKEEWSLTLAGSDLTPSGADITAAGIGGYADDFFTNGFIMQNDLYQRLITAHTGSTITLLEPLPAIEPADNIRIFAGCDRSFATCRDKFSNGDNHGGYLFIPKVNPFDQGLEG